MVHSKLVVPIGCAPLNLTRRLVFSVEGMTPPLGALGPLDLSRAAVAFKKSIKKPKNSTVISTFFRESIRVILLLYARHFSLNYKGNNPP